jgi:putative transposase
MKYRRLRIEGGCYFFTVVTHKRRPIFSEQGNVDLLMRSLRRVQEHHPFELTAHIVLPDHLHMLWDLPDGDDRFSTRWRLIKEAFTRAYRKHAGSAEPVWQHRFWEHAICNQKDFADHLDYIHFNPVRHGYAKSPAEWPHSSYSAWVDRGVYERWWGTDAMPPLPSWIEKHE